MNSQLIRNFWLALMFCFIGLGYYLYKQKKEAEAVLIEPAVELVAPEVEVLLEEKPNE